MHVSSDSPRLNGVLAKLVGVRRAGPDRFTARCPGHDDKQASLSVRLSDTGRVLCKCFAGCSFQDIVAALDMGAEAFFPDEQKPNGHGKQHKNGSATVSVDELAAHKRLPAEFLRGLGWRDVGGYVEIPYCRRDGSVHRMRHRKLLSGNQGSTWAPGDSLIAYEPDRGALAACEKYVVLVEGETDTATLLFAGFPAIGVPGATATHVLEREYFDGLTHAFVVREPDQGGDKFIPGVKARVKELGLDIPVYELRLPGAAKDSSALYQRDPDSFPRVLSETMRIAMSGTIVLLDELLEPAIARAELRRSGAEKSIPVPFSRAYSEALGGGYFPGAHYIVSTTGIGKSQFALQVALGSALAGTPAVYAGLELEPMQIALRVLGDRTGSRWSSLYLGRCNERDIAKAREAAAGIKGLPFYCDFAESRGWPPSRLVSACETARQRHRHGPLLVVIDYLQLIGDDAGTFERKPDTRERISAAATTIRDVANKYDAAVVVISSTARAHYELLASDGRDAGLVSQTHNGSFGPVRTILRPGVLLGLGKESGETEYSADSVTVLIRWPAALPSGDTAIICATPKVRSVGERWCALAFDGGRFRELADVQTVDDLPAVPKRSRAKAAEANADDEPLIQRAVDAVRKAPGRYTSRTGIADATGGKRNDVWEAVKRAADTSRIVLVNGAYYVPEAER